MMRTLIRLTSAVVLAAALAAVPAAAGETNVGPVEVTLELDAVVKGDAFFPDEVLELERVDGPPVRVRFDRIHRLVFHEVKRVERAKESLRAAFYHVERVGGGSGLDGFIRGSRPVHFTVRNKRGARQFEIGTENPVKEVVFPGNMARYREKPGANTDGKEFVLGQSSKEYTVVVPGNTRWLSTGIKLVKGQTVHFTATGKVKWGTDPVGKDVGPDGRPHAGRKERPLPGRHLGMLIARINPFHDKAYGIGSSNVFKTPADGELELGINDDELEDNTGNFRVLIKVDPI